MKRNKKLLALIIAIAMVITNVPQSTYNAYAAESTETPVETVADATAADATAVEETEEPIVEESVEDVTPLGNSVVKSTISKKIYVAKNTSTTVTAIAEGISSTSQPSGYTYTYQWYKADSSSSSTYSIISGATQQNYTYTTNIYSTWNSYYTDKLKCEITVTNGSITEICNYFLTVTNSTFSVSAVDSSSKYLYDDESTTLQVNVSVYDDVPADMKAVTYQWKEYKSGSYVDISGATSNSIEVACPTGNTYKDYRVYVKNKYGCERYVSFYIYKYKMISSLSYKDFYSITAGSKADIEVKAELNNSKPGAAISSYEWYTVDVETEQKTKIEGANSSIYTIVPKQPTMLECVVTAADGSSKTATIQVDVVLGLMVDTQNGTKQYVAPGNRTTLSVAASSPYSNAAYTYQWYMVTYDKNIKLDGETNSAFTTDRIIQTTRYMCEVTLERGGYKEKKYILFEVNAANGYYFAPNFEDFVPLGTALSLNATVTEGALSIEWEDINDEVVAKDVPSFTPSKSGVYDVYYKYISSDASNSSSSYYNYYGEVRVYENRGVLTEGQPISYNFNEGEYVGYSFTASKTGKHSIYTEGNFDTFGYLVDSKGRKLESNDDGDNRNFKIEYNLIAGQTYTVVVRGYSQRACAGELYAKYSDICGHPFSEIKNASEPTCTANGYTGDVCCEFCMEKLSEGTVIPAKGHTPAVVNGKVATFKAAGYTGDTVCTTCGATLAGGSSFSRIKSVSLKKNIYSYTGKNVKASVVVKDADGKIIPASYYTVSYSKNLKSIGVKTVKVKFKGAYSGTKTLKYTVAPKNVSGLKASAKSRSLKISWKKQTKQSSGYQISYATNKKFKKAKSINITKNKTTNKTIKSLKKGTTYYVRIRTYKKIGKKKYYSEWSKVKSVKIKK